MKVFKLKFYGEAVYKLIYLNFFSKSYRENWRLWKLVPRHIDFFVLFSFFLFLNFFENLLKGIQFLKLWVFHTHSFLCGATFLTLAIITTILLGLKLYIVDGTFAPYWGTGRWFRGIRVKVSNLPNFDFMKQFSVIKMNWMVILRQFKIVTFKMFYEHSIY